MVNYTSSVPGITSPSERYMWAFLHILIFIFSLFGDSVILLSSVKYHAIKLHRITVAIIQHLAVLDLILSFNRVLPIAVSLLINRWVFGDTLCLTQQYLDKICFRTVFFLTCTLTSAKFMTIKYPLKSGVWSDRKSQKLCLLVEIISLVFVSPYLLLYYQAGTAALYFNYSTYNCDINAEFLDSSLPAPLKNFLHSLLDTTVPICIYIIPALTSGLMLWEARRVAGHHNQRLRWEGVMTVLLTCTVYYISFIPHTLTSAIKSREYFKFAEFLLNLNIISNFFIYTLTVKSFRTFLRSWIRPSLQVNRTPVDIEMARFRLN